METNADGLRKAAKRVFWEAKRIEREQDAYAASVLRELSEEIRTNGKGDRLHAVVGRFDPLTEREWKMFCLAMEIAARTAEAWAKDHDANAGVTVPSERQSDRIP